MVDSLSGLGKIKDNNFVGIKNVWSAEIELRVLGFKFEQTESQRAKVF